MIEKWFFVGLFLILPILVLASDSHLDFFELDQIKYAIAIDGEPLVVKPLQSEEASATVAMTNKFGQKYHCLLPDVASHHSRRSEEEQDLRDRDLEEFQKDLLHVLTELVEVDGQSCLFYTKDWWTYELCPYKNIKQYHVEEGKILGKTLILGEFTHDHKWTEENRSKESGLKHHIQFYEGGTVCDLTKNPRKTDVQYYCEPSFVRPIILQVTEPASCEYVIKVGTNKLCEIPELKPEKKEEPSQIKCHPALNEEEYHKYEIYEKERKSLEEIRKKQSKEKQKLKMLKVLGDSLPRDVDINTDEGYKIISDLVEEKMADKLVNEIERYLNPDTLSNLNTLSSGVSMKKIFSQDMIGESFSTWGSEKSRFFSVLKEVLRRKDEKKVWKVWRHNKPSSDEALQSEKKKIDSLQGSKDFRKTLQESLKELVKETEKELGSKMDDQSQEQLEQFEKKLNELMEKLDKAEAEIQRVNQEIIKVQENIDNDETDLDNLKNKKELDSEDDILDDGLSLKRDNKKSVKKELREEDFEEDDEDREEIGTPFQDKSQNVQVKVDQMSASHVSGLNSPSSSSIGNKVSKRIEQVIKEKLAKAGLDTGGRQIEVKLVTSSHLNLNEDEEGILSDSGLFVDGTPNNMSPEEALQFQDMVYNLMTGNQKGYEEIDGQRKSERNYKFQWTDSLLEKAEELVAKSSQVLKDSSITENSPASNNDEN